MRKRGVFKGVGNLQVEPENEVVNKAVDFQEFLEEELKDPEFKKEYDSFLPTDPKQRKDFLEAFGPYENG